MKSGINQQVNWRGKRVIFALQMMNFALKWQIVY